MKSTSTLFLKIVIILFGLAVLTLCLLVLPRGIVSDTSGMFRPLLIGMYIPAIPFFIGLIQTLKILSYIDKNQAFSQACVNSLNIIKYCALTVSILYALGIPYIFYLAQQDDAPGVVLIGLIFTFAPLVIAVFAAVFQNILQKAINIKLENDLIV